MIFISLRTRRKTELNTGAAGYIFEFMYKEPLCVRPPQLKRIDSIAVIQPRGSLMGGDETSTVLQIVRHQIATGSRKIILDFSKVTWINSHGMGMLMGCYAATHEAKGSIGLAGVTKKVSDLLCISQVHKLFDTFSSVKKAVQTYAAGGRTEERV